jgi:hypothetical protein
VKPSNIAKAAAIIVFIYILYVYYYNSLSIDTDKSLQLYLILLILNRKMDLGGNITLISVRISVVEGDNPRMIIHSSGIGETLRWIQDYLLIEHCHD